MLQGASDEKDLGIIVQDDLSPRKHISKVVGGTYRLITKIKTPFTYMDEEMLRKLIVSMIGQQLEHVTLVWSQHKKKDITTIERIQRTATRLAPSLINLTYEERLDKLGLISLEKRRERGDLIAMYRTMNGMDKLDWDDLFVWDTSTREHGKRLKTKCLQDVKKYNFLQRCIDTWNGLDIETVEARCVHDFKDKIERKIWRRDPTNVSLFPLNYN